MFEWIFGKKEDKKEEKGEPKKEDKKEDELSKDDKWIYDYVRQYLSSPLWRNPLLDFIEENSLIFEDVEENKFEYTKIFQEFTGLTSLLLESMIEQVGITETILQKCIIKGIRSERDTKIFQQVLLCDNFVSFKKIMVAKNKELQVEAMTKIQKESKTESKAEEKQLEINTKELERLELEKAIAMSIAIDEKSQEEKELEEAIRLSQEQFHKEEVKRVEEKKKVEEKTEIRKTTVNSLPPLSSAKPPRPIQEYKEEETKLKVQIEEMKKQEDIRRIKEKDELENQEDRKKRLLEQRELIRKKKQEDRKEDLATFMQTKPVENKLSEEEMERRRSLMKRLKEQLKE